MKEVATLEDETKSMVSSHQTQVASVEKKLADTELKTITRSLKICRVAKKVK